jgi:hypothetical protein
VLEDRHDNERTNGKEEGSCERKQHMSVFRFHESCKARSKGPNELEDTANMNRGPPWRMSSSSHHRIILQLTGSTSSDYRNLRLWIPAIFHVLAISSGSRTSERCGYKNGVFANTLLFCMPKQIAISAVKNSNRKGVTLSDLLSQFVILPLDLNYSYSDVKLVYIRSLGKFYLQYINSITDAKAKKSTDGNTKAKKSTDGNTVCSQEAFSSF